VSEVPAAARLGVPFARVGVYLVLSLRIMRPSLGLQPYSSGFSSSVGCGATPTGAIGVVVLSDRSHFNNSFCAWHGVSAIKLNHFVHIPRLDDAESCERQSRVREVRSVAIGVPSQADTVIAFGSTAATRSPRFRSVVLCKETLSDHPSAVIFQASSSPYARHDFIVNLHEGRTFGVRSLLSGAVFSCGSRRRLRAVLETGRSWRRRRRVSFARSTKTTPDVFFAFRYTQPKPLLRQQPATLVPNYPAPVGESVWARLLSC
jgi:hypothetical protein